MADIKITALPALAVQPDSLDVIAIVDVSDNGVTASGTTKHITIADLAFLSNGANISLLTNDSGYITSADFSNGGELALADRDLGNTDAFGLSFITSGVGRINILSTGEVGIGVTPTAKLDVLGTFKLVDASQGLGKVLTSDANGLATWSSTLAAGIGGIYDGSGTVQAGATTVTMSTTDTLNFGDALHIDFNNDIQRVAVNATSFTGSEHFRVNGGTLVNLSSGADSIWEIAGTGHSLVFNNNGGNNSTFIFDSLGGGHHNLLFQESGVIKGNIHYDLSNNVTRGDGFKFYAKAFATNTETLWLDQATDNVVVPNGNVGIGTNTPTQKLDVAGNALVNGVLTVNNNGVSLFDGGVGSAIVDLDGAVNQSIRLKNGGSNRLIINTNNGSGGQISFYNSVAALQTFLSGTTATGSYFLNPLAVGTSSGAASTRMTIEGSGTTSATNGLIIYDAGKVNNLFRVRDDGNVGIGTGAPSEKLEVAGSIKMVDGNQALNKVLTSDANGVGSWQDADGNGIFDATNSGSTLSNAFNFRVATDLTINGVTGTQLMKFNTTTGVEIGNPVGGANLIVNTNSANPFIIKRNSLEMAKFTFNGNNPTLRMYNQSSVQVVNINAELFVGHTYFNTPGNFGIGTTTPSEKLDVNGTANATAYKVGGVAGVTQTGAYTNFTIVGGIITAAS